MEGPSLSPSGEAAWQSLRQHIEWTPGFWIGWIFTDHTLSGREIVERAAVLLRDRGRRAEIRRLRAPEELGALLGWLMGGADGIDGCVAVEVIRQSDAWIEAWEGFLLRLNERREVLRASLRGGLLFVTPTALKAGSRAVAPDLWSIRSLALDVEPPALSVVDRVERLGALADARFLGESGAEDLVLAEQALAAARQAGQRGPEIAAQIRRARALKAEGRGAEAREAAALAVDGAPNVALEVEALETLAEIEGYFGDLIAAERHYRAAYARGPDAITTRGLLRLSYLLRRRLILDEALALAQLALSRSTEARRSSADLAASLREELLSHRAIGDAYHAWRRFPEALQHYRNGLDLGRRRGELVGETPEVIGDEALTQIRIGDAMWSMGQVSSAMGFYQQGLDLERRLRALVGDTSVVRGHEAIALERLGDGQRAQGDLASAQRLYEESLALNRAVRALDGDTESALLGVILSLLRLGDVERGLGETAQALARCREGLALSQSYRRIAGDTEDALRNEALAHERLGDVLRAQGDETQAREHYQEGQARFQSSSSPGDALRVWRKLKRDPGDRGGSDTPESSE